MNKNSVIVLTVVTLIVGFGIGLSVGKDNSPVTQQVNRGGMHQMPDGSMMGNEPMDMASMMASMNNELRGKTGDAFDQAFVSEMIVHHQGAVEMAELALTNAKHQEIKDLAKAIISAQKGEIAQMKQWQTEWYGR